MQALAVAGEGGGEREREQRPGASCPVELSRPSRSWHVEVVASGQLGDARRVDLAAVHARTVALTGEVPWKDSLLFALQEPLNHAITPHDAASASRA